MELAYVLLGLDVLLFAGLWVVYRTRREEGASLVALAQERAALEVAAERARAAAEEAIAARVELERTQRRVERHARQWALSASTASGPPGPAEVKVETALRAMRRS